MLRKRTLRNKNAHAWAEKLMSHSLWRVRLQHHRTGARRDFHLQMHTNDTHTHTGFQRFHVFLRIMKNHMSLPISRWESPVWIRVAESKLERKRPTLVNISTPPFKIHASSWHGKHFRANCISTNKTTRTVCHCMSSIWLATKQPKGGFEKITLPHAKLTVFFE